MENNILLSICIPTYNRKNAILNNVTNILKSQSMDFEIVVLDNCSTDGTYECLSKINDSRLKLYKNEKNIGGIKNPIKIFSFAKAKYSILVLDKDILDYEYLQFFLNFLEENMNIIHGVCELNSENNKESEIIYDFQQKLRRFSFRSAHPSGMFFNTKLIQNCEILSEIMKSDLVFGFWFEIINLFILKNTGMCVFYNKPLIKVRYEGEKTKENFSHTYVNKNIFFLPKPRIKECITYCEYIKKANFIKKNETLLLHKVIKSTILNILSYRKLRKNELVCFHYGLEPKNVGYIELLLWLLYFCNIFIFSDIGYNIFYKIYLFFSLKEKEA